MGPGCKGLWATVTVLAVGERRFNKFTSNGARLDFVQRGEGPV